MKNPTYLNCTEAIDGEILGSHGDKYEYVVSSGMMHHIVALMMEAVSSYEMSVSIYKTTSQKTTIFKINQSFINYFQIIIDIQY
jgi:hypothetical protein